MNTSLPQSALMAITNKPAQIFTHGLGSYLFDQNEKRYLDWVQGWAVNALGHSPSILVDALQQQAMRLINPSPAFYNQPALDLAAHLVAHSCFDQVFFANSGAEANEGAIKLARKWGSIHKNGAFEIITFSNAFHGRTLATMSATGKPHWEALFAPKVPGFPKASYNDLDSVAALISHNTVAIMLEPIQGEAGVIPATPDFMHGLRTLCDQHHLLLIVDEVQTGCGRTGPLFAYESSHIQPDIMTLGKGIGGGVPLSALLAKNHACCFEPGDQGGTYCGNPLMCAAGLAVMQTLTQPGFLDQANAIGQQLQTGLQALSQEFKLGEVRGSGLLLALVLSAPQGPQIVETARDLGLLINSPRPNILRFMPALTTTAEEVQAGLALLKTTLHTFF